MQKKKKSTDSGDNQSPERTFLERHCREGGKGGVMTRKKGDMRHRGRDRPEKGGASETRSRKNEVEAGDRPAKFGENLGKKSNIKTKQRKGRRRKKESGAPA